MANSGGQARLSNECAQTSSGAEAIVIEAWGQGVLIGALLILICTTIASMRKGVLLHKLIVAEMIAAAFHGTFIFVNGAAAPWYLSATAVPLYISYNLHNLINWLKIRPFLSKAQSLTYVGTVFLAFPYWVAEMYFNFAFNNHLAGGYYFTKTRPWEALCREPWWLLTTAYLMYIIKRSYDQSIFGLIRSSSRFAILVVAMALSIAFIIADVTQTAANPSLCLGRNPYWKFALVTRCLADAIFLDDFKSVLDKLTSRTVNTLASMAENHDHPQRGFVTTGTTSNTSVATHATLITNFPRAHTNRSEQAHGRFAEQHSNHPDDPSLESVYKNSAPKHVETVKQPFRNIQRTGTREWFDMIDDP